MLPSWRPDAKTVLRDKKARTSLVRYFDVMENEKTAKFLIAKKLPVIFNKSDSLSELWQLHEQLTEEFSRLETMVDTKQIPLKKLDATKKSFLDLKMEIANRRQYQYFTSYWA